MPVETRLATVSRSSRAPTGRCRCSVRRGTGPRGGAAARVRCAAAVASRGSSPRPVRARGPRARRARAARRCAAPARAEGRRTARRSSAPRSPPPPREAVRVLRCGLLGGHARDGDCEQQRHDDACGNGDGSGTKEFHGVRSGDGFEGRPVSGRPLKALFEPKAAGCPASTSSCACRASLAPRTSPSRRRPR